MSSSHWEEFYATHLPPADFEDNRTLLKEFCDRHNEDKTPIVLVTVSVNGDVTDEMVHFMRRMERLEEEEEKEEQKLFCFSFID